AYTPPYLTEKILASRSALEGERKQVTVLFADIKDSTELIRDLDAEVAQQLLDPAIHRMMDAVHRYEGTVNQVLGDGIMALFGAPLAHEDHALRACFAALALQALAHLPDDSDVRGLAIDLRLAVDGPLTVLGEHRRRLALLGEAEARARALDDRARLGRVLSEMAVVLRQTGAPNSAAAASPHAP